MSPLVRKPAAGISLNLMLLGGTRGQCPLGIGATTLLLELHDLLLRPRAEAQAIHP